MNASKLHKPYQPYVMDPPALIMFEYVIKSCKPCRVYEFGAGNSTPWLAANADEVISAESDPEWHKVVTGVLEEEGLTATVNLMAREKLGASILAYEDESFDVVYVDCWSPERPPAIRNAGAKIKHGGWLIIDDAHWSVVHKVLGQYRDGWDAVLIMGNKTGPRGTYRVATTQFMRKGAHCCG